MLWFFENILRLQKLPDSNGFIVEYFDGSRHVLSVKDGKNAMYEREVSCQIKFN